MDKCEKPHAPQRFARAHRKICKLAEGPGKKLAPHTGCLMNKLTAENRGAGNQIRI
jgi:hypothetical protein